MRFSRDGVILRILFGLASQKPLCNGPSLASKKNCKNASQAKSSKPITTESIIDCSQHNRKNIKGNPNMRKAKLRTKLAVGFGMCIMVMASLSGYAIIKMQKLGVLQDDGAKGARDAEIATEASFIAEQTSSVIADAIINRNLGETAKSWEERKLKSQERLKLVASVVDNEEERVLLKKAEADYKEIVKLFEAELLPLLEKNADPGSISAVDGKMDSHRESIRKGLKTIAESLGKKAKAADSSFDSVRSGAIFWSAVLSASGILAALTFAFAITRSISKPINRVVEGLNEGADQVSAASGQVSSSSQQLAEGASEQAAAIEEISSSLEEMAAMTKQNAENAEQANSQRQQVGQMLMDADGSIADLAQAMVEISAASAETQKIIKTIDEIAFQTNLLALNAAVEAARAGEAGAGFAVVADEVRNLAMRAAEAAKNTNTLIEGTTARVQRGSELSTKTIQTFAAARAGSQRVGEMISEIASASSEQAQGIEQVNKAVAELDKVVQQNAANAEESASASEEMNAQAHQMRGFVEELITLVNGSGFDDKTNGQADLAFRPPKIVGALGKNGNANVLNSKKTGNARGNGKGTIGYVGTKGEVRSSEIIPFDEDEMKGFKNF
jgi:methyl-accepting chemotaxis protein